MSDSNDEVCAAIALAQAGDARGFETLFGLLGCTVAGYLRARRVSDPDGVANDVFVRAFRSIHTFRGDAAKFRAWVFTIAHHAAVDDARRRRRRVSEAPLEHADHVGGDSAEEQALARLAQERVEGLLDTLSPDQRDVLVLRFVSDLSISETAAVLDKSVEAVKALQHRGLGALRRAAISHEGVSP